MSIYNRYLAVVVCTCLLSQIVKGTLHAILNHSFDIHWFFNDGGMPSSHSAVVSSLATITALSFGLASYEFAIAVVFAMVVFRDAIGVRRETGKQAVILNEMLGVLKDVMNPETLPETKLKEFVGHTPMQVMIGCTFGIFSALLLNLVF